MGSVSSNPIYTILIIYDMETENFVFLTNPKQTAQLVMSKHQTVKRDPSWG